VVATLTNGNVVVLWDSFNQYSEQNSNSTPSMRDVYGQIFSPTGQKIGGEFLLNQFTPFNQRTPAIAALASGGFVAAWVTEQQRSPAVNFPDSTPPDYQHELSHAQCGHLWDGYLTEPARRWETSSLSTPPPIHAPIRRWQRRPGQQLLGRLEPAGYARCWKQLGRSLRDRSRASHSAGRAARSTHTWPAINSRRRSASMARITSWSGPALGQDGSWEGVYGQFLQMDGTPSGSEFRVNTTTISKQQAPWLGFRRRRPPPCCLVELHRRR